MYQLQLLLNIPELFTSQSKIDFYSSMFENLDLSSIPEFRGCTKYAIISSDYRSSINRDSLYFKAVYRLRIESER